LYVTTIANQSFVFPLILTALNMFWDVDSNIYNAFCEIDEKYLVKIIKEF